MKRNWFYVLIVICVYQAAVATSVPTSKPIPEPSSVITVGPGTVISVRVLDLPFVGKSFVITYGTDRGGVIEVWHRGKPPVVPGMHGMMIYCTHPEMLMDFRVVQR
jgi:hypothetical protein